ncbi:MAG TPA: TolC family protein, partial [Candidatus Acidoferrum sp.]|nr:TolC family protein [Candidatus Acidoferrum sp.]
MIRRKASVATGVPAVVLLQVVLLFCVCGCTVGPNYKRPDVNVPGHYRGLPHGASVQAASETFAEMKLSAVFPDEVLQGLLKEALANNYDVRIAATRVLQADADLGITRANQLPSVNVAGGIQNQRTQPLPGNVTTGALAVQASWILDFWGQYRRATEAARANLLATQYAQGIVRITLISAVANTYFQLRAFD